MWTLGPLGSRRHLEFRSRIIIRLWSDFEARSRATRQAEDLSSPTSGHLDHWRQITQNSQDRILFWLTHLLEFGPGKIASEVE